MVFGANCFLFFYLRSSKTLMFSIFNYFSVSVCTANRDQKLPVFHGVHPLHVDSQFLVPHKFWVLQKRVNLISAVWRECLTCQVLIVLTIFLSFFRIASQSRFVSRKKTTLFYGQRGFGQDQVVDPERQNCVRRSAFCEKSCWERPSGAKKRKRFWLPSKKDRLSVGDFVRRNGVRAHSRDVTESWRNFWNSVEYSTINLGS